MSGPLEWELNGLTPIGFSDKPGALYPVGWYRYGEKKWSDLIADSKARNSMLGVHCFTDDVRFESLWVAEISRQKLLDHCELFIAPDFSISPKAHFVPALYQIWRSNVIAAYLESRGLPVVPVLMWGPRLSPVLEYAADGIKPGAVVALRCPAGLDTSREDFLFWEPLAWFLDRVKPCAILWAGPRDSPHMDRVRRETRVVPIENVWKY